MAAPILLFAIGNESRGDDALVPLLVRGLSGRMEMEGRGELVEYVTDLTG